MKAGIRKTGFLALAVFLAHAVAADAQSPAGTITGQVFKLDGTPAAGVPVVVAAASNPSDSVSTATDTSGRYTLDLIRTGRYTVAVRLGSNIFSFHPAVAERAAAAVIELKPGSTLSGIDIRIQRVGVKVSGRVSPMSKAPRQQMSVSLTGGPMYLEAVVGPDGAFTFADVAAGYYFLRNTAGTLPQTIQVQDKDITGLTINPASRGVRVAGKLIDRSVPNAPILIHSVSLSGGEMLKSPSSGAGFVTESAADGSFEFFNVPPGIYTMIAVNHVNVVSHLFLTMAVTVGDSDVTGLEYPISFEREITGAVVIEGGGNSAGKAAGIHVNVGSGNVNASADGAFKMYLPPGDYRISLGYLPAGYIVKSFTYGSTDLLQSSLRVSVEEPARELRATLAPAPTESSAGVVVSGRVVNHGNGTDLGRVMLTANAPWGYWLTAPLNDDGAFEFRKVPPGVYSLSTWGRIPLASAANITVGNADVRGIEPIPVPQGATSAPQIILRGRVTVYDESGKVVQGCPFGLELTLAGGLTNAGPDGSFDVTTPQSTTEVALSFRNVPKGYAVRSAVSGSTDLLKSSLRLTGNAPEEIRIELDRMRQ